MTTTNKIWTVARRDAWGGVAEYRYRDTPYLVGRGGDCDRFWVIQNEATGEFGIECPAEGHALPTRAYAAMVIEALIEAQEEDN